MGQTTDQITSEIHRASDELKSNLEELETRVKNAADWRAQFNKHPGPMTVAALVGGALISLVVGTRSSRRP
jgi:hypothetical protein